jgi:hypothetical protein
VVLLFKGFRELVVKAYRRLATGSIPMLKMIF